MVVFLGVLRRAILLVLFIEQVADALVLFCFFVVVIARSQFKGFLDPGHQLSGLGQIVRWRLKTAPARFKFFFGEVVVLQAQRAHGRLRQTQFTVEVVEGFDFHQTGQPRPSF